MSETMMAAVFKGDGVLVLEERPVPEIKDPHDIKLAVKGVGVCGTDLHILEVPPRHPASKNVIIGHEFCGEVVEVGSAVTNCKPGDHITVDQNAACGHCDECRRGVPNACTTILSAPVPGFSNTPGIFFDGASAKYIVIPDYKAYPVATHVPWHHIAVTEIVACAFNAVRKAKPEMGETAVVLGAGPVGLLITAMLKTSGCRVISSEVAEFRRSVAKRVGADVTVNPKEEDLNQIVADLTKGKGAEIVVEAVGPLLNECIDLARINGRVVLFGHDELARPVVHQALVMRKELQILGAFNTKFTFSPVIRQMELGMLPMDDVISNVMPLDQIFEAHRMMRAGEALKIVIDPSM